jgi:hypothetical protein
MIVNLKIVIIIYNTYVLLQICSAVFMGVKGGAPPPPGFRG